jgi:hypothetical protein
MSAFTIGGNNYFKRAIWATPLGFIVGYDAETDSVSVASGGYSLVWNQTPARRKRVDCEGVAVPYKAYGDVVILFEFPSI